MRQRADRSDIFNRLVNSSEQHIIMETDQESGKAAASCPAASQNPLKTGWQSSSKRGTSVTNPPCDVTCRFQGDGVRYKAKLIGMDFVPVAQGEKTCLDSMMKLKGQEVAARNQGRHKQRVWLKVTAAAVTILDERTGLVIHSHEPGNIHSLTKDEYDPRALSYIYNDEGTHVLFYIKMANLADPVLDDIKEVCQSSITQGDQVTENSSALLLFDEKLASPKALDDMDQFSPIPASPSDQQQQISSKDELRDIFSVSSQNPCMNQQGPPLFPTKTSTVSHKDLHCFPQGLPLFPSAPQKFPTLPGLPVAVTPFTSLVSVPWVQQGPRPTLLPSSNGPWGGPAVWLSQPGMTGWTSGAGGMMPNGVPPMGVISQPGRLWGQNTLSSPISSAPTYTSYATERHQQPVSPTSYMSYGTEGHQQPVSPTSYMSYGTEGHQQPVSPTSYMSYGTEGHQQPVSPTSYMSDGTEGHQQPVSPTSYSKPAER
ncbi:disabled homolog 2 isoform X2 [Esox lucius]|uniref:disabled homolog 2 isoform X2 n=1 Tax=Esox lucius TaxID=8010 RepID=UPI0014769273|nr:disabled homolog 2 isoform X2 [Esox lucius]